MKGAEYERALARVRRTTCSEPWTEAVVHRGIEYPPGGDTTGMKLCHCPIRMVKTEEGAVEVGCGGKRWWPGNAVGSSGLSYECFLDTLPTWRLKKLPGSTSSINQARLNAARKSGRDCAGGF